MSIPDTSVIVEGHAIVSVDGMIAAADGSMPPALRNEADWRIFQAALDAAVLVVLGRLGHERNPNPGRKRLVLSPEEEYALSGGLHRDPEAEGYDAMEKEVFGTGDAAPAAAKKPSPKKK